MFPLSPEECKRNYRKYADSVTILAALYDLFKKNDELGEYIGIESKLKTIDGREVEPDFLAFYDNRKKGLLFELKWSLPINIEWLENELDDLNKYFEKFVNWKNGTGKVDYKDVVLVCNIEDSERLLNIVRQLCKHKEYGYIESGHFCILCWSLIASTKGDREENLRMERIYGKTNNMELEKLLDKKSGIIIPEKVLEHLRWRYFFIRQKPPLSYLIITIIQHILNAFPADPYQKKYEINIDTIYLRSQIFFPSWNDYDKQTKQVKRNWIVEALNVMSELKIIEKIEKDKYGVPKPVYRKKGHIDEAICKDLYEYGKKRREKGTKKSTSIKRHKGITGTLDKWLKEK